VDLTLRTAKTGLVATRILRPLPLHTPPRVLFTKLRVGSDIEPTPREDDGKAVCRVSDGTEFRAWLADPWFVSKAVPLPCKGTPLGIDSYMLYAIPRFAGQPISGAFGPDLQTTMSVTGIVANEQVLCPHILYELANHIRPSKSEICAFCRRAPRFDPPAPSVAEGTLRHAAAACG
jgi:hypothetical protein